MLLRYLEQIRIQAPNGPVTLIPYSPKKVDDFHRDERVELVVEEGDGGLLELVPRHAPGLFDDPPAFLSVAASSAARRRGRTRDVKQTSGDVYTQGCPRSAWSHAFLVS